MIPHFRLSTGDAHTEAYCIMSIYECPNPYERLTNAKSLCTLCAPPRPDHMCIQCLRNRIQPEEEEGPELPELEEPEEQDLLGA